MMLGWGVFPASDWHFFAVQPNAARSCCEPHPRQAAFRFRLTADWLWLTLSAHAARHRPHGHNSPQKIAVVWHFGISAITGIYWCAQTVGKQCVSRVENTLRASLTMGQTHLSNNRHTLGQTYSTDQIDDQFENIRCKNRRWTRWIY